MSGERRPPDVDAYLKEVSWAMGGSFSEQQTVRDELRAHLRDAARDLVTGGMTAPEALARALSELGDVSDMGRAMRPSRGSRPLRRPLMQPAGAILLHSDRPRNLPNRRLALALAAVAATPALVALAYAWPG
jgi:hypothetical protein